MGVCEGGSIPHITDLLLCLCAMFVEFKMLLTANLFIFSGSGIENWHSIIREGLVVGSGTKLQVSPPGNAWI